MKDIFSQTKAIIFDMDGVLFLTTACHAQAFAEALAPLSITGFSYDTIAGMRTDEAFRQLFKQANREVDDMTLDRLVKQKQERVLQLLEQDPPIAPGSGDVVTTLAASYRLALASSASRHRIELFLDKSGYGHAFAFFLDGHSVVNAKPAPDIYARTVERLGLAPAECVVIEDAINGVQAAVAAGIPVVALIDGPDPAPFLAAGASMVVSGLTDLIPLFKPTAS